ncbi:MAG: polyamine ABC transporter substrate-binding protein [Succinivibrionaceae bacterium]|nr:polyamine ABC transporter substrate-binding protein [Ruminobacter sp.]MDY5778671.1 polyamine ABC transporter substrate-binding protein [Succinivibrionaceae bacterium]MEE1340428.1 polyamine ABC transporter substrate-binding protein [Succinivibrionaceae bacterium]
MFKKTLRSLTLCVGALIVANSFAEDSSKELYIYNWNEYIDPQVIPDFEKETGIKVKYDLFDSNEVLESKVLVGGSGYDIVAPGSDFLSRQIEAGAYQTIDKSKLKNYGNLDPVQLAIIANHDKDNAHSIPWMGGTTGIGYNKDMIAKRLGADYVVDSWDIIFKEENLSKLKDCGVAILNAPTEVLSIAMHYLGLDPNATDPKAYKPAEELLKKVHKNVTYYHSSQNINDLANGDICITVGWSGDLLIAAQRAKEANNGVNIEYIVPKEGTLIFYDMLAIPADAPHPENALIFMDYVLRPEVMAKNSNYVSYASANKASLPYVREDLRNNKNVYLPEEMMPKMFIRKVLPQKTYREINKMWNRIKTSD